jgi:hypothetical protein
MDPELVEGYASRGLSRPGVEVYGCRVTHGVEVEGDDFGGYVAHGRQRCASVPYGPIWLRHREPAPQGVEHGFGDLLPAEVEHVLPEQLGVWGRCCAWYWRGN